MTFNKFKPNALNEAFCANLEQEVTTVANPVYANAVEEHKARKEKLKDDFNQVITDTKKFVDDNHKREKKVGGSKEMKKMHLSEALFEDATVEEPVKKRPRAENEKKWIGDYSSEDLWLAVYDELSATTDNEGKGQQVDKQIKARRGERYEHVYPHGDSDIIIYATKPEEFEFAKKVANHYGVVAEEPKEDTNKLTNGFYKYSMIIRIPEEGLYSED